MFYEKSFAVPEYRLKLREIDQSYLKKLLKWLNFYTTDLPVSALICRLDFLCFVGILLCAFSTLSGFFFFSVRPGDQQRRQLEVIFDSRSCIMESGVALLARKTRVAMTVMEES